MKGNESENEKEGEMGFGEGKEQPIDNTSLVEEYGMTRILRHARQIIDKPRCDHWQLHIE